MNNCADSSSKVIELTELTFVTTGSASVEASHTHTDWSDEPETMRVPSAEKATERTGAVWPLSTFSSAPVEASHTRTDMSCEPETMCVSSVEKATELTE